MKLAGRVAVYTLRDTRQLLGQLAGARIHRGDEIPIRAFDRSGIEALGALLDRRVSMAICISERHLFVSLGQQTVTLAMTEHRI